jgi:Xaa-Pro dipeptidase
MAFAIRQGDSRHLSWLMETGQGDFFLSDTALLGPAGSEVLTQTTVLNEA